ncbi:MAG TPA: carboxypeptidase regulatory-like domain-containing protein [Patescibacteria group bacterium]|nr:carboxypeptidase regulatory-like domain-containing protein [Patescibacteria group bacterium]
MTKLSRPVLKRFGLGTLWFLLATISCPSELSAQTTISTGSIQGTVTDPGGAAVPAASVTITNVNTGQSSSLATTATGTFASGALFPGDYSVRVEAQGFKTLEAALTVQVGVTTPGNFRLEIGAQNSVVTVSSTAVQVNTEQPTIQGVLGREQIEDLPFNGRNFLDLAQLEPGVQIQDGGTFDPTKDGFSAISVGSRWGRSTRIEIDGIDITDETVGTTTQNVPASAIQEFQISQSTLDLSTELTSSGAVNVVTRTGTNALHGGGYWYGRDDSLAAKFGPTPTGFDRHQYGANLGGPIVKDKLFFFGTFERTAQNQQVPVVPAPQFDPGDFNGLFRDLQFLGRLDYQIRPNWNLFFRFNDEQARDAAAVIPDSFQPYLNLNHTWEYVLGTDFSTGGFTHSIRFGWLKFVNYIGDATASSGAPNPVPGISVAIGGDPTCTSSGFDAYCSGPSILAPQNTLQQNTQIKYDGSRTIRSHILRYGFGYNRIETSAYAALVSLAGVAWNNTGCAAGSTCAGLPGGDSNPANYSADAIFLGNGQGYFTERPAFGRPAGGTVDNRLHAYLGDSWKILSNLTVNYGATYVRDTGRTDSDLAPIPCSATTLIACNGLLLDQWGAGLGKRINQPNDNFGGSLGLAWDPWKNGKTVIRAGAGIYYENFRSTSGYRVARLPQGLFSAITAVCPNGFTLPDGTMVTTVNGKDIATQVCGQPIGTVANDIMALEQMYQQATAAAGPQSNPVFIGNNLAASDNSTGSDLLAPNYVSPYSIQMNIGAQRELHQGTVLSVDYLRNVFLHYPLGLDANHTGDSRYFNLSGAQTAVAATNASFGCPGDFTAASINCAIGAGATIADYAGNGLDSGNAANNGFPCPACAFPGKNPNVGNAIMFFPIGRSVYNGLQVSLQSRLNHPLPHLESANFKLSYALSRFDSQGRDVEGNTLARNFRDPGSVTGPFGLDRTNMLSAGGVLNLPWWTQVSFITHYYTALPVFLRTAGSPFGGSTAGIFTSDLDGDGSFAGSLSGGGDLLPGTKLGALNRTVSIKGLANLIDNFNNTVAGTLTPAGQVLVQNGLFTTAQLKQLGATIPYLQPEIPNAVATQGLFTFDSSIAWNVPLHRIWKALPERVVAQPRMSAFNLFNYQNYDPPNQLPNGNLSVCPVPSAPCSPADTGDSVSSTSRKTRTTHVGLGSGTFALGAPRQLEWGVKLAF